MYEFTRKPYFQNSQMGFALFITAIVLRWTVCIIMEIWWVLVLLAVIGIGIYAAFHCLEEPSWRTMVRKEGAP